MKKTLVAVAALATISGAMAEVTISGFFDQGVNTTRVKDGAAAATTTTNSVGPNAIGQDQLVFSVTEDIGDGIKAFGQMALALSQGDSSGAGALHDVGHVGLKGSFGSIKIGSDYDQVWYTQNTSDASGWGVGVGNVHGVGNTVGSHNGSVIYSLPTLMEGLGVVVEKTYANGDGNGNGDAIGWSVAYSTGPFMAKYASRKTTINTDVNTITFDRDLTATGLAGTAVALYDVVRGGSGVTTLEGDVKNSALAVSYDMGVAKLHYGNASLSVNASSQSIQTSTYGVTVPLGAFNIGYAYSKAKTTDDAGDSASETGSRLLVKYALSKRTNLYVQYGTQSTDQNQSATGSGFGITHSF